MIDVGGLRALRAVAELGTVGQAAEQLGFTASAVSQQIKRLERQIGVALVAPAGRKVVLTPAGQVIVDNTPEVFQALERCAGAARSIAGGVPRGRLRVVAFSTAVRGLLTPAVAALAMQYADMQVCITEQDPREAVFCVDSGKADVALVHDADGMANSLPESLKQRLVHTDFGDVVMRRTHPLAASEGPLTAAELTGHSWVASPHGTVCHQWFQRLFAEERNVPDVRHQIDDFSTQIALAATEDLLALIPHLARPPLGPSLVYRALHRPPKREVFAVWRCSSDTSPNIRALLAALPDESLDSASGVVVPG